MKTIILIILLICLYPMLKEGFISLCKDILLAATYTIAALIKWTKHILTKRRKKTSRN